MNEQRRYMRPHVNHGHAARSPSVRRVTSLIGGSAVSTLLESCLLQARATTFPLLGSRVDISLPRKTNVLKTSGIAFDEKYI